MRLRDRLIQILRAEAEADALRRRFGSRAEARLRRRIAQGVRNPSYERLVERALRATTGRAPAARRVPVRPVLIGAAGVALALAGIGVASANVGPTVSKAADLCLPLLSGQAMQELAPLHGVEQREGAWMLGTGSLVEIVPPGGANPQACSLYVTHSASDGPSVVQALEAWASAPGLAQSQVKRLEPSADGARLTSAWSGDAEGRTLAVVLSKDLTPGEDAEPRSTVVIAVR